MTHDSALLITPSRRLENVAFGFSNVVCCCCLMWASLYSVRNAKISRTSQVVREGTLQTSSLSAALHALLS